jgi:hypothetical protein
VSAWRQYADLAPETVILQAQIADFWIRTQSQTVFVRGGTLERFSLSLERPEVRTATALVPDISTRLQALAEPRSVLGADWYEQRLCDGDFVVACGRLVRERGEPALAPLAKVGVVIQREPDQDSPGRR